MVSEFEVLMVEGQQVNERLVRVRLSDPCRGVGDFAGRRWNHTLFHEIVSERNALSMCLHLWDDIQPCWKPLPAVVDETEEAEERARRARRKAAYDSWWRGEVNVSRVLRLLRELKRLSDDDLRLLASLPGTIPPDIAALYNAEASWPMIALAGVVMKRQEKLAKLERWFTAGGGAS
jgi:hypothetical protein